MSGKVTALCTMLGLAAWVVAGSPHASSAAPPEPDARGVVVRFEDGATLADVGRALGDARADVAGSTSLGGVALVAPGAGRGINETIAALESDPDVLYAEPDYRMTVDFTPNDTYYGLQWAYPYIGLEAAWDETTGNASVVVAVVDTGVELGDSELDGNLVAGFNTIDGGSADDDNGHGTHVAGTIAAESNDGTGVAGICQTCKIMPIKAMAADGTGWMSDVAEAIDWARTNGADVINLSLGSLTPTATLETAVDNAWNAGVIVVAASGNYADDAIPNNDTVMFPAAYANAIAVGAFDSSGTRAPFSNYGPELDVSAPGVSILSTVMGAGYGYGSGTSMATPHVAGLVGLMISNGITDKDAIRAKLISTTTDAGTAGFDNYYGWGRINAAYAVDNAGPTASITAPADGATVSGASVSLSATAADASGVRRVRFLIDGSTLVDDASAPYGATWDSTGASDGPHTVAIEATDNAGNTTSDWISVTVSNADVTPPTVSITGPANGATVSGTVAITANASDNVGVYRVRFYVDGAYAGFDSSAPYAKAWDTTGLPNGPHTIVVRAWDTANNVSADATVTVTVDNGADVTPPAASITGPSNGATVSGTVAISANASDNVGVYRVRFYIDGAYAGFDSSAPYAKAWDTTGLPNGPHTIVVRAWDAANNVSADATVTVTVDNGADVTPPAASITGPSNGATVSGTVAITANASDNVGVYRVRFYIDGAYAGFDSSAPYAKAWDTTALPNGPHTIVVRAWDAANNVSADATVTVTVSN